MSLQTHGHLRSRTKIDILIPVIEKDLKTLPFVVHGVRRNVKHPIGQIFIVAPRSKRIMRFCKQMNCTFMDENSVLPIRKQNIRYRTKRWSGWILQQLLKLSGDRFCSQNFFLVLDADTVLIRPHIFRLNQKTVFYCRNWSHHQYFRTYQKLLGRKAASRPSFVNHYMLFEKSKLSQLKRAIQARHKTSWHSAILKCINRSKLFAFSEFETYGNFVRSKYPGRFILRRSLNKMIRGDARNLSGSTVKRLTKKYRSISFHKRRWYYRK
ncbi:DUF6492 family protein [Brevibacillus sp. H7]|jgi:hypothetical protein|uniref:DUF6492 family protein n=1 Tax=Brevibacillus sp. H7 TaxID=3349138 RepID=UPI0038208B8D